MKPRDKFYSMNMQAGSCAFFSTWTLECEACMVQWFIQLKPIPQPIKVGNKLRWWRFMISDRFGIGFLLALAENDESIFDEVPDEQWA